MGVGIILDEYERFYGIDTHHSKFLNSHFKLRNNGYDWDSESGLKVEFKESFSKDNKRFAIYYKDLLHSDVIVCCNKSYWFYVVPTSNLVDYTYGGNTALAQPSISVIKERAIASFKNVLDLKEYLNHLTL